jgi:hypothetical protein
VYLDQTMRRVRLPLRDFVPAGHESPLTPEAVETVLFVVDSLNTALGQGGQVWLDTVSFGVPTPGAP